MLNVVIHGTLPDFHSKGDFFVGAPFSSASGSTFTTESTQTSLLDSVSEAGGGLNSITITPGYWDLIVLDVSSLPTYVVNWGFQYSTECFLTNVMALLSLCICRLTFFDHL